MNAVIFIRNLFTVLSLGTILKAQQIGKDIDLKLINEILFLISSLYAIYRIDYKKVISCYWFICAAGIIYRRQNHHQRNRMDFDNILFLGINYIIE